MCEKLTENPVLMREWNYEKNAGLTPDGFTGGSDRKVWWICELGHCWQAQIKNRRLTGCPFCAGKKVWVGFNDILTTHPHLAIEWHYEKNAGKRPEHFTAASNKIVWWKCELGHSWKAMINNRNRGQNCPYCAGRRVLLGFNDLVTTQPEISDEWDYEKNGSLRPDQFTAGSNVKVWWKCEHGHSWKATIYCRKKHGCPYCSGRFPIPGISDLLTVNPDLAKEWDDEKNGDLRPDSITAYTHIKAWWRCEQGHSWQAAVSNRSNGVGCPYCTNRMVLQGFNDLLSVDPELSSQWDYEKNAPLRPDEVLAGSEKKVYWKCAKNHIHSYMARIVDRRKGNGCPVCASKVIVPGENDLKTLRPEIADEWDDEKNGSLRPEQIPAQSTLKVWWRCGREHSYRAVVYNRYYGTNCPYCAGNLPIIGETDLATVHPELLSEWDYEKNYPMRPEDYTASSNKKVWWRCEEGHSWKAVIYDRHNGCGCPYCAGKTPMRTRLVK